MGQVRSYLFKSQSVAVEVLDDVIDTISEKPYSESTEWLLFILSLIGLRPYALPLFRRKNERIPRCCVDSSTQFNFSEIPILIGTLVLLGFVATCSGQQLICWNIHCDIFSAATTHYLQNTISVLMAFFNLIYVLFKYKSFHMLMHKCNEVTKRKVPRILRIFVLIIIYTMFGLVVVSGFQIVKAVFDQRNIFTLEMFTDFTKLKIGVSTVSNMLLFPLIWIQVGFYASICVHLYVLFNWAYDDLVKKPFTKENIGNVHYKYLKAAKLTQKTNENFSMIVMVQILLAVVNCITGLYGISKELNGSLISLASNIYFTQALLQVLLIAMYLTPPIMVFEKVDQAINYLVFQKIDDTEVKKQKDELLILLSDRTWPLSFGGFAVIQRGLAVSIFGIVFSTLILLIEFSEHSTFDCCVYSILMAKTDHKTFFECKNDYRNITEFATCYTDKQ
uniref:Gustatory receptor n=1 Tax=Rhabditophanes sp. KR3021 TaxID=114890 RepID=A0AC35TNS0_9BILA